MKGAKQRRVGKKRFNQLISEEIAKVETQRPARVKRNGVEINTDVQKEYIQDIEDVSTTRRATNKPLSKNGRLKVSYFNAPCIYMLYKDDKIVYIGQTECLARRIGEHLQSTKVFDSFSVHSFKEDEYIRLKKEQILIRKYKPVLNVTHK